MSYGGRKIRHPIRGREPGGRWTFHKGEGGTGSFVWARVLGGCGLGRKVVRHFPPWNGTSTEHPFLCHMEGGALGVSESERSSSKVLIKAQVRSSLLTMIFLKKYLADKSKEGDNVLT